MVYVATLSESQSVMRWILIFKECFPHIQHISRKDNIVADMLSHFPSKNNKQKNHLTVGQVRANKLFVFQRDNIDNGFPFKLLTVK